MKRFASAAVGISLLTFAVGSQAADDMAGKLGEKGTLAIHAATGSPMLGNAADTPIQMGATPTLGFSTVTFSEPETCTPTTCTARRVRATGFYINPRLHYFVIDNLSIGGELLFATFSGKSIRDIRNVNTNATNTTEVELSTAPTGFGLMPMIGYNIALGDKVSLWPQGGIGFRRFGYTEPQNAPNPDIETSETWWFVNVDVPFLIHIAPHFELGAGPGATFTLSQSYSRTAGARTDTVSGYATTAFRWFNAHLIGYF